MGVCFCDNRHAAISDTWRDCIDCSGIRISVLLIRVLRNQVIEYVLERCVGVMTCVKKEEGASNVQLGGHQGTVLSNRVTQLVLKLSFPPRT